MKKLFPEAPDVSQSTANRATRIIEKHLRVHRVSRASDLSEEAKVRLYRDLSFYFDSDPQSPGSVSTGQGFTLRGFLSRMWEKLGDFLSASEANRSQGAIAVLSVFTFGEPGRLAVIPRDGSSACEETS